MSTNGHTEFTSGKSLFRIGEVSRLTDTKPFVLRYWETEFPMLQPVKSPKGHRLYRREDVETVRRIKRLLYDEGFTIAGARRHLRDAPDQLADGPQTETQHDLTQREPKRVFDEGASPDGAESVDDIQFTGVQLSASRQTEGGHNDSLFARSQEPAPSPINRQALLDLRDSLRAFLTLLESE